ncbi:uncharacterized protein [Rutidosis leptorrhynchoides]|uniref:uncharacterized protein n=1 Tax=Rutidosis leptorrhynchoides TaxID=125765 RepID=UPI003A99DF87
MRIQSGPSESEVDKAKRFEDWVLAIGDGRSDRLNGGEMDIGIPEEFVVDGLDDHVASLVDVVYSSCLDNIAHDRRNEDVSEPRWTLHLEGMVERHNDIITPEFLSTITSSGVSRHELNIKVGIPVMLLRNIDQLAGLSNGTRLMVTRLGDHVIEGNKMTGSHADERIKPGCMCSLKPSLCSPFSTYFVYVLLQILFLQVVVSFSICQENDSSLIFRKSPPSLVLNYAPSISESSILIASSESIVFFPG